MAAEQIPLDLGNRTAFAREDFWVTDCNRDAVAWLDKWPDWPSALLVIHGPAACGKTHLCRVLENKAQDKDACMIIDDADRLMGNRDYEEKLFHIYTRMQEEGRHILMTASQPPRDWKFALHDLRSRVIASPAVAIAEPDDQLRAVVLTKLFSDRQIFVPQDVVQFILARVERSLLSLRNIVADIDRKAMAEKRAVTIPLVKDILQKSLL